MPGTGILRISGCSQACGSIMKAINASCVVPQGLSTLGAAAGKTAPYSMTGFYNFAWNVVNLTQVASTGCGGTTACACLCLSYSGTRQTNECYCVCLNGDMATVNQGASSCACFHVTCNSVLKYCCVTPANSCSPPVAVATSFCVDYNDTVNIVAWATTTSTACSLCSMSAICINTVAICSGGGAYCKGTTCTLCCMCTG